MALRSVDRKLSRAKDARRVLIKTLATQLVQNHAITTTTPRAKTLLHYVERLTSLARKGGLSNLRLIEAKLDTTASAHHLTMVVAPQLKRTSGFLRLKPALPRSGDGAPMATVSFVDDIDNDFKTAKPKPVATKAAKAPTRKKAVKS
ncbi:MAG TPA: 50S ribosomal protein L17 [Candidatus Saccharimonadales bacterium]